MALLLLFCSLLTYVFISVEAQAGKTTMTCRSCQNAETLDDCTGRVTCRQNEECYMDEIITSDLQIVFDGGCRSTQVCGTLGQRSVRSVDDGLIACSHCCNTPNQNSSLSRSDMECNAMLCGLKPAGNSTMRCRICFNARTLGDCIGSVTCQENEECYMDEIITSDLQIIFNGGCRSTQECGTGGQHSGRSVDNGRLIACTSCCNTPHQNSSFSRSDMECNAMLCGLKPGNTTIRCRSCLNARTLDDCTRRVTCRQDEECYMDEIITSDLQIVFDGGCRSTQVCGSLGKRSGRSVYDRLIACSHCCNTRNQNSSLSRSDMECNAMLCGLKPGILCYHCQHHQGTANHSNLCYNTTVCPSDQVCRVTTSNIEGNTMYSFGCYSKLKCQLLTKASLIQHGPTSIDLGLSTGIGRKRQSILCDVCCGENLCNNDECHIVRERLIGYANASQLDYDTLRLKL